MPAFHDQLEFTHIYTKKAVRYGRNGTWYRFSQYDVESKKNAIKRAMKEGERIESQKPKAQRWLLPRVLTEIINNY